MAMRGNFGDKPPRIMFEFMKSVNSTSKLDRQKVLETNIKLVKIDVMQEHVNSTQVIGSNINFLSVEPLPHVFFSEYFSKIQQ